MGNSFWQRRIVQPVLLLLKQGLTPEKLALTISLGIALGTVPVLGSTSISCALAAAFLGLNQAAIQGVNYLAYPLQLVLLIPFLKLGALLFGDHGFQLTLSDIQHLISSGIMNTITTLWTATMHGIVAWGVLVIPAVTILYFILCPVLRLAAERQNIS